MDRKPKAILERKRLQSAAPKLRETDYNRRFGQPCNLIVDTEVEQRKVAEKPSAARCSNQRLVRAVREERDTAYTDHSNLP